jgi:uncharacterized membrane protein SpoIIM required for sporulation
MKVERLISEREGDWRELDRLLGAARGRAERLPAPEILRLGALYRGAAADLALVRRRAPHDPLVDRLGGLVLRGRQALYAERSRRASLVEFFTRTYWVRVRERPGALALAWALLLVPAAIAAAWAISDPGSALGLVPGAFRQAVDPVGDTGMSASESAAFSSSVLTNNIQVTFLAFAAGLALGIGTAVVLVYNGVMLGAIVGGAVANGNTAGIVEFVTAHGIIELSCIAVAASAGLRLGYAIAAPGPLPRGVALAEEGRRAMAIVLGTVPWIVLAGIIEGFVTRAGFGLVPGIVLGVGVGATYWGLVLWRGRPQDAGPARESAYSRARALART